MTLGRALGLAATDLYHHSWRLIVLNTLLGAVLLGVVLASLATPAAVILVVLVGPAASAVMHCAVVLAQTEDLRLAEFLTGLRRHWRRGSVLGVAGLLAAVGGIGAVRFWSGAGTWGWPLAVLCIYLLLMFVVVQLALWPLSVFEETRPFREVVRDAAVLVVRRPGGFAALAAALLAVNAVGVAAAILPFLTLTIAYSFLAAAHFALPRSPIREV